MRVRCSGRILWAPESREVEQPRGGYSWSLSPFGLRGSVAPVPRRMHRAAIFASRRTICSRISSGKSVSFGRPGSFQIRCWDMTQDVPGGKSLPRQPCQKERKPAEDSRVGQSTNHVGRETGPLLFVELASGLSPVLPPHARKSVRAFTTTPRASPIRRTTSVEVLP